MRDRGPNHRWWALAALVFALFMITLDDTIVAVALPSISRDLHVGLNGLEWVVNSYLLTFAALVLSGGRLADLLGRRRIYLTGLAVFTASSLAAGLAPNVELLVAARATQGVGAALMMPAMLGIISASFAAHERGLAIGIWSGVSAVGLVVGPLAGGLLTEHASWSWIFFVNVPIGLAGLAAGGALIPESRDDAQRQPLDLPGLASSALALFALVYALIEANSYGWRSPTILALFASAALAAAAFVWSERRRQLPMLDLALFRNSTFAGANTVSLLVMFAMFGVFFFLSLYLQQILGYSAIRAGAAFLPMMAMLILVAPAVGKLADHTGPRWPMTAGLAAVAAALLLLSQLQQHSSYSAVLPGLLVAGFGMSLALTPMTVAALSTVPDTKASLASGVLNASQQAGGAFGIAVLGAILTSHANTALAHGASQPAAFVDGFTNALLIAAAVALAGAAVSALAVHPERKPARSRRRIAGCCLSRSGA
ncbi:MAG: MFS transporter [Acidobacteriota bacterium]|nr:MFS transporter [Acidobacteriota bacterium]